MKGINLDKPITFLHSSLRYFAENEYHVERFCKDDVLLMVFEGVLRFTEDNVCYEIHPGEYHIQKSNTHQFGGNPSDSPKYLYVHFRSEWADDSTVLPFEGTFDYKEAKRLIDELDRLSHTNASLLRKSAVFFEILLLLQQREKRPGVADSIAQFINEGNIREITLEKICNEFHFSKNHVINIFKKEFGLTPVKYINNLKLQRAKYLLEVTSDTLESIAANSGFNDYSHFYKLFYRENGLSPALWRSKKHTEPLHY
nr:helix-turn-helix transcriptional regulator [Clostridia bacterium]